MTKITWLGHASWLIETADHCILLDPFLIDNPAATAKPEDFQGCTHILVSHGHFDHISDAAAIASQAGATVISGFEIAEWFAEKHQIKETVGMNIGGKISLPFGSVQMIPALHSNSLPDGSPAGSAAGFLLTISGQRIYFACDTAFFGDMSYYAKGVDLAVLPIGDLFTMGISDSIHAIKTIEPKMVLPSHYGTWPPIAVDIQQWSEAVRRETKAEPKTLAVNDSIHLPASN